MNHVLRKGLPVVMNRSSCRILRQQCVRSMTLVGPAANATEISDDLLNKLGSLSTQALVDGLWVRNEEERFYNFSI